MRGMLHPRPQNETPAQALALEASAGLALACTYSSSDEYEAEVIHARRKAFKAGLSPGMKVIAVNGKEYSSDVIKDAVTAAAKDKSQPVELLVKNFDEYTTLRIDYHDGLKYPHLERIQGKPDRLSELLKAR